MRKPNPNPNPNLDWKEKLGLTLPFVTVKDTAELETFFGIDHVPHLIAISVRLTLSLTLILTNPEP